jgi:RHS repeat-associated protein
LEIKLVNITNKTLYTSPYLVVNDQEYTKHFYAESQRLASKLGAGLASSVVDPILYQVAEITSSYENKRDSLSDLLARGWDCSDIESGNVSIENTEFNSIAEILETSADEPEGDMYFYHTDHLGSSSWITDASGSVNQHLQYLPFATPKAFGDIYQRSSSWNVPYTFSGKEKDSEIKRSADSRTPLKNKKEGEQTGYSYFGARYYDSELSIWLSVDPVFYIYPSTSPYLYVKGNPINLVDPNGLWSSRRRANKFRNKAIKKYGIKRVGSLTKKNGEYGFSIYPTDKDKVKVQPIVKGDKGVEVISEKGQRIESKKRWKNYIFFSPDDWSDKSSYGTLDEFVASNKGKSYDEIINQRGKDAKGYPRGPNMRFVEDPSNPGKYIDMRHFLVVGNKYGSVLGGIGELWQLTKGKNNPSANKRQDYWSNTIGEAFFFNFSISPSDKRFTEYLKKYLKNRSDYDSIID